MMAQHCRLKLIDPWQSLKKELFNSLTPFERILCFGFNDE